MTRLEFNELVERLDEAYAGRSQALSRATAVWLALGYGVLFAPLAICLIGGLAMIAVGVWLGHHLAVWLVAGGVLLLLLALGVYGRLAWTPRDPARELVLKPEDAPELHALVDELRRAVGCRRFNRIVLCPDLTAGVKSEFRFGLLGRLKNVLILGLPLMEILSPEEFRVILAHEFAHHSQAHGRFSVWVYRVRSAWETTFRNLDSPDSRTPLRWVAWFLRWYWPRMNARAFLLCREHEYAADQFAVEHVGTAALATSLWRLETGDQYLDLVFWPAMQRAPERATQPPADFVSRILECLSVAPDPDLAAWCALSTCARLTDTADTHPAWADRVAAVGEEPARYAAGGFLPRPGRSAAHELLGSDRFRLWQAVSEHWAAATAEAWQAQHRRLTAQRRRLQQIARLLEERPLDVALHWEHASLVKDVDGIEPAAALLERLRELNPRHRGTAFELGQWRLSRGDPAGEALLEEIIHEQRDSYFEPACLALRNYFGLTGRFDDMREMEARLDGRDAWAELIRDGHRRLAQTAPCLPHGLETGQVAAVVETLRRHDALSAAWLVRVSSRYPGSPPLFVLCVSTSSVCGFGRWAAERRLSHQLIGQIAVPGRLLVIASRGSDRRLARRAQSVPDSQIFPVEAD